MTSAERHSSSTSCSGKISKISYYTDAGLEISTIGILNFSAMLSEIINKQIKSGIVCVLRRKANEIYDQMKELGSALDWSRATFTMDPVRHIVMLSQFDFNCCFN